MTAPAAQLTLPLTVRDMTHADLPACAWSGTDLHLGNVARQLDRAARGQVDYLALCPPSGMPVALGGVDYFATQGVGTLWQLAVHPALRSCGIGTVLIRAAEDRVLARGLDRAELTVELSNPRARALYERLGYRSFGQAPTAWDEQAPDGSVRRYDTVVTLMYRQLG